jgi:LysR family transcriptional regulator, flagellar master operon regulator
LKNEELRRFISKKSILKECHLDTELARTFLAVVTAGNFVSAAERLHVTQSTVSARIQTLETSLGSRLFVRNKGGTTLTAAGRHFQKHASTLVRTVERARQEVGVARGFRGALTIGGRFGLWEHFLTRWLAVLLQQSPGLSVRAEVGLEAELMQGLVDGRLDIAVMYTPERRPGLQVEPLFDERLVFASTEPDARPEPGPGYVYVDWGPEFFARHSASFPDFFGSALTTNIGWLGLHHVLDNGGSGYFPIRLVRPHLQSGRLAVISGGPEFVLTAYAVYPTDAEPGVIAAALEVIREAAVQERASVA